MYVVHDICECAEVLNPRCVYVYNYNVCMHEYLKAHAILKRTCSRKSTQKITGQKKETNEKEASCLTSCRIPGSV